MCALLAFCFFFLKTASLFNWLPFFLLASLFGCWIFMFDYETNNIFLQLSILRYTVVHNGKRYLNIIEKRGQHKKRTQKWWLQRIIVINSLESRTYHRVTLFSHFNISSKNANIDFLHLCFPVYHLHGSNIQYSVARKSIMHLANSTRKPHLGQNKIKI